MESTQNNYIGSQQVNSIATNSSGNRDAQKAHHTETGKVERKDLAEQAGLGRDKITDLNDLGALSRKDDDARRDHDNTSSYNFNEETGR